jgi:hypothetical protein
MQLMEVGSAHRQCVATIRGPAILERLEAHGVPGVHEKAAQYLEMADLMNRARQMRRAKQAAAFDVDGDLMALRSMLGVQAPQQPTVHHPVIKQAAAELACDSTTYNAVLSLAVADAAAG